MRASGLPDGSFRMEFSWSRTCPSEGAGWGQGSRSMLQPKVEQGQDTTFNTPSSRRRVGSVSLTSSVTHLPDLGAAHELDPVLLTEALRLLVLAQPARGVTGINQRQAVGGCGKMATSAPDPAGSHPEAFRPGNGKIGAEVKAGIKLRTWVSVTTHLTSFFLPPGGPLPLAAAPLTAIGGASGASMRTRKTTSCSRSESHSSRKGPETRVGLGSGLGEALEVEGGLVLIQCGTRMVSELTHHGQDHVPRHDYGDELSVVVSVRRPYL